MTLHSAPPIVDVTGGLLDTYRRHLGAGRAAVGQLLGGMVEVESSGAWIRVADGRRYLDFGGYGVFILGHRHPVVVAAVHEQLDRHPLASRTFLEPVTAAAAGALAETTPEGLDLVHFVNSGAEATEAALKLARIHGCRSVITTTSGFHGKTLGALSVTAKAVYQQPFRPLLPGVTEVAYGDLGQMEAALTGAPGRAVVILEPIQGEGGVVIPPAGYLRAVAELCQRTDALFVIDEIQTGMGRLGTWWGIEPEHVVPDILLVGKGLSGGVVPIAAMVATERAYAPFAKDPYLHTSTFAGSPLACSAAVATIAAIHDEDIVGRAKRVGAQLLESMRATCRQLRPAGLVEVRGRGLLIGIEFTDPGAVGELALELVERGVISCHSLNSSRVLRFTPPAILDQSEIGQFLTAFGAAVAALGTER
ncbi:aspartate aminotransferase family protein [Pedococcus sp. 5OH_020]|uniref:aspartate aminotransferase family protein n=1 Tax=Pedococcus sp. 5OH_020 TaxID=2989814 RepID=UPI0022E9AE36|nr:aminotransferase class III-fold pyridoxal phosphate-dependent enzyme [Pedococcus sp. 5OH_020]